MKIAFSGLLLICLVPAPVEACTCRQGVAPCQSVWQASGIVEATVVSIEDLGGSLGRSSERLVRLESVRPIIGEPSDTVVTGADPVMCGYKFAVGTRYLIVMHKRQADDRATTSICSPTQPASWGGPFKNYLEDLSKSLSSATLTRRLTPAVLKGRVQFEDGRPAGGALVVVEGADEQRCPRLRVGGGKANASGEFALELLEYGSYEIAARLEGLSAVPVRVRVVPSEDPITIVLKPKRAGLRAPFRPRTSSAFQVQDLERFSGPGLQVRFRSRTSSAFQAQDLERFSGPGLQVLFRPRTSSAFQVQDLERVSGPGLRAPFRPRTSSAFQSQDF